MDNGTRILMRTVVIIAAVLVFVPIYFKLEGVEWAQKADNSSLFVGIALVYIATVLRKRN